MRTDSRAVHVHAPTRASNGTATAGMRTVTVAVTSPPRRCRRHRDLRVSLVDAVGGDHLARNPFRVDLTVGRPVLAGNLRRLARRDDRRVLAFGPLRQRTDE